MIQMKKDETRAKKERADARQEEISKNLLKLEQWKNDIVARKENKEMVSYCDFLQNLLFSQLLKSLFFRMQK